MTVAGDLSDAEQRVWDAFPTGKIVEFGTENAGDDDPAAGESWGLDRQVRAEVLARLLCGALEVEVGQTGGIYLIRARITGELRLPDVTLKHRLHLDRCHVADGIDLSAATTRTLDLRGCQIGAISLYNANVNGAFNLSGARLDGKDGPALAAQGLTVTGTMFCDEEFHADGAIDLSGGSIGSQLSFSGAHLHGKDGPALTAQGLTVTADMICSGGFQADGAVDLSSARIGSQLILSGAHPAGKDGPALNARELTVSGKMYCDQGFQANGAIVLADAKIGTLVDQRESWSQNLRLDGLTYGDMTYLPARQRLEWLGRTAFTGLSHMRNWPRTIGGWAMMTRPAACFSPGSADADGNVPGGCEDGDCCRTLSLVMGMRRAAPCCCWPVRSSLDGWCSVPTTQFPWDRARIRFSTLPCTRLTYLSRHPRSGRPAILIRKGQRSPWQPGFTFSAGCSQSLCLLRSREPSAGRRSAGCRTQQRSALCAPAT